MINYSETKTDQS